MRVNTKLYIRNFFLSIFSKETSPSIPMQVSLITKFIGPLLVLCPFCRFGKYCFDAHDCLFIDFRIIFKLICILGHFDGRNSQHMDQRVHQINKID